MLAVPIFIPALIAGVKGSAVVLGGATLGAAAVWIRILLAFDVIYVVAGYLLFEHVAADAA
jgi:ABC-type transport system involved in cytochrome c biogenesis permease component